MKLILGLKSNFVKIIIKIVTSFFFMISQEQIKNTHDRLEALRGYL